MSATTTSQQSLKLYGRTGINPTKVKLILHELSLRYEAISVPMSQVKLPAYVGVNANGRLPALHDERKDLLIWESGAIVEYLVSTYDQKRLLSFEPGSNEDWLCRQWLYFQVSGQGPYNCNSIQAFWFLAMHSEQLTSAIDRYFAEVRRVTGVLEEHLSKEKAKHHSQTGDQQGPWLVGNRMTYADIAFVPWQAVFDMPFAKGKYSLDDYPVVKQWMTNMRARDGWADLLAKLKSEQ